VALGDFKEVVVADGAEHEGITARILRGLPQPSRHMRESLKARGKVDAFDLEKHTIHLLPHKGAFLKPCPGTRRYICCGYRILNVGTNCPLDCSYCILQAYFNQPHIRVFANLEEELGGILRHLDNNAERIFRIGTGEFTDSLALDPLIGWSELLLPAFSSRKNVILELKTKTAQVSHIFDMPYRDRIVVSWSLNSPEIASQEEHGAAPLKQRLEAARRCQREGFVVGFHFDPLFHHPGWRDGYRHTLDMLDRYVDPRRVIWISLGAFRYMPALKEIIRYRHPGSCVLDGEFISGLDRKMRYVKPIRIDLYSYLAEGLRQWHGGEGLYLCMESDDVWEKSLGWSPKTSGGLSRYLDGRVRAIFG
jgi:spore photoproduct lyase